MPDYKNTFKLTKDSRASQSYLTSHLSSNLGDMENPRFAGDPRTVPTAEPMQTGAFTTKALTTGGGLKLADPQPGQPGFPQTGGGLKLADPLPGQPGDAEEEFESASSTPRSGRRIEDQGDVHRRLQSDNLTDEQRARVTRRGEYLQHLEKKAAKRR